MEEEKNFKNEQQKKVEQKQLDNALAYLAVGLAGFNILSQMKKTGSALDF